MDIERFAAPLLLTAEGIAVVLRDLFWDGPGGLGWQRRWVQSANPRADDVDAP